MKTCFKCGIEKPLADFYVHPKMADGHLGKCKDCARSDNRSNYAADDVKARQLALRRQRRAYARFKGRVSGSVNNAIRDGKMERVTVCQYCLGTEGIQAHHWNYSRAMDVTWLCQRCHLLADKARKEAELKSGVVCRECWRAIDGTHAQPIPTKEEKNAVVPF